MQQVTQADLRTQKVTKNTLLFFKNVVTIIKCYMNFFYPRPREGPGG